MSYRLSSFHNSQQREQQYPLLLTFNNNRSISQQSYNSFDNNNNDNNNTIDDNIIDDCDDHSVDSWYNWNSTATIYKNILMTQSHQSYQPIEGKKDIKVDINEKNKDLLLTDDNTSVNTTPNSKSHNNNTNKFEFLPAGSVRSSVFNLCSATLGAGALSIPYAFESSGLLIGLLLLTFIYVLSCYSISLLINSSLQTQTQSYEQMAQKLLPTRILSLLVDINILLFCFGTCVGYLVGTADIIHPIMINNFGFSTESVLGNRNILLAIFTICIMLPLSCSTQINQLRFCSFIGVVSLAFLVICVVIRSIQYTLINGIQYNELRLLDNSKHFSGTITTLSILMYAFTCQPNVFSIYTELIEPTPRTMNKVVVRSFGLSSLVYISIGIAGWLQYNNKIQSDILSNLDTSNDMLLAIAQLGLGISITLAYPLNVFPARNTIVHMLWPKQQHINDSIVVNDDNVNSDKQQSNNNDFTDISNITFYCITVAIVMSSLLTALYATNLSSVFALIGSTTSSVVCFILPPIFYLYSTDQSIYSIKFITVWLMLLCGITMGIISTVTTIYNML